MWCVCIWLYLLTKQQKCFCSVLLHAHRHAYVQAQHLPWVSPMNNMSWKYPSPCARSVWQLREWHPTLDTGAPCPAAHAHSSIPGPVRERGVLVMWNAVQGYPGFLWTHRHSESPILLRPVTEHWLIRGVVGSGSLTFLMPSMMDTQTCGNATRKYM